MSRKPRTLTIAELRAWAMEPVHVAAQERDLARRNAELEAQAAERDAYTARADAAYSRLELDLCPVAHTL